ncbi:MAG: hypothetical protein SFU25_12135 [Candidatus Caenarcaniphilales bacterium]|nr:hypothetical protein [Candidatus Caenarcaniphilales bacterium]
MNAKVWNSLRKAKFRQNLELQNQNIEQITSLFKDTSAGDAIGFTLHLYPQLIKTFIEESIFQNKISFNDRKKLISGF